MENILNSKAVADKRVSKHRDRIGDTLKDSVITKDFKVHNINNLYISGSSSFRIGTYKNPTFAIIQFSLKLANDLKNKLV